MITSPRPVVVSRSQEPAIGPLWFGFKPGECHLIFDGQAERLTAFDFYGKRMFAIRCLARRKRAPGDPRDLSAAAWPGLYRLGSSWFRPVDRMAALDFLPVEPPRYGTVFLEPIALVSQGRRRAGAVSTTTRAGADPRLTCGWELPGLAAEGCAFLQVRDCDFARRLLPLLAGGVVFVSVRQVAAAAAW
jgi:hypothetical protein